MPVLEVLDAVKEFHVQHIQFVRCSVILRIQCKGKLNACYHMSYINKKFITPSENTDPFFDALEAIKDFHINHIKHVIDMNKKDGPVQELRVLIRDRNLEKQRLEETIRDFSVMRELLYGR